MFSFVYFGFLCLQVSSVSNFCPDIREWRWSLIQTHLFSCAVGREEHHKQISLACVGSACSVWATQGLPPLTMCVRSWSTLLRLQVSLQGCCPKQALGFVYFPGSCSWVLHKGTDMVKPAFCALPRSKQLRWPSARWAHCPRCVMCLITSPVPVAEFPGCAARAQTQVCHFSSLGSWSQVVTLLVDVNYPGSWEDLVSNWEPAHSLVEDAVSGPRFAPCFPGLAVTACLSASGRVMSQSEAS